MRKLGIGTAIALAGVLALVAGGIAVATRGDDATVRQAEEGLRPPPPPVFFHGRGGERRDQFAKDLAAELDIDAEKVEDALRAVFKKHLDQAVEDEWLTQRQADRILKCYDGEDECRPPGLRGRRGFRGRFGLRGRFDGRPPHDLPTPPPVPLPHSVPLPPPPGM